MTPGYAHVGLLQAGLAGLPHRGWCVCAGAATDGWRASGRLRAAPPLPGGGGPPARRGGFLGRRSILGGCACGVAGELGRVLLWRRRCLLRGLYRARAIAHRHGGHRSAGPAFHLPAAGPDRRRPLRPRARLRLGRSQAPDCASLERSAPAVFVRADVAPHDGGQHECAVADPQGSGCLHARRQGGQPGRLPRGPRSVLLVHTRRDGHQLPRRAAQPRPARHVGYAGRGLEARGAGPV
mmetsp:Transcript_33467/g.62979  ORF Transcript_33467/g.62979 Transcript_33467/m.62979 type:complete len:238 (-) Transcript_33467:560-1273(-)